VVWFRREGARAGAKVRMWGQTLKVEVENLGCQAKKEVKRRVPRGERGTLKRPRALKGGQRGQ
jgi:hypothetical protein